MAQLVEIFDARPDCLQEGWEQVEAAGFDGIREKTPSGVDLGAGFYSAFHSKSRANVTGYNNPEMDTLLAAQLTETDAAKREKILCDIVTLLNRDVPIIYRGGQRHHTLAKSHVKGFVNFRNGIAQLADIWIDR